MQGTGLPRLALGGDRGPRLPREDRDPGRGGPPPGPDALLAPEWVPWSERLRPGDLGPGDLLPTDQEDLRLEPGYTGEEQPLPNSVMSEDMVELADAEDADVTRGTPATQPTVPTRGSIAAVAQELGLRRARVLSRYGLHTAADRWEEGFGPKTPMAQAAPATCLTCGFLNPIGGSLGQAFGVCANEFSPADGRVVSWRTAAAATRRRRSCRSRPSPLSR